MDNRRQKSVYKIDKMRNHITLENFGILDGNIGHRVTFKMYWCFLSKTKFCGGVSTQVV